MNMLKNDKKRERSSNFTTEEENILLKCVLLRKSIIECRKTDAMAANAKKVAWDQITADFNARCPNGQTRSAKTLRYKYGNAKASLRKRFLAEKANGKATDDGKSISEWQPKNKLLRELAQTIDLSCNGNVRNDGDETMPADDVENTKCTEADAEIELLFENVNCNIEEPAPLTTNHSARLSSDASSDHDVEDSSVKQASLDMIESLQNTNCSTRTTEMPTSRPNSAPLTVKQKLSRNLKKKHHILSWQELKKNMLKKEMEMREEEHILRLKQSKIEHKAQMEIYAAQMTELAEKSEYRKAKLALLKNKSL